MEKAALKHLIYGGLKELLLDRNYYHHSPIGEGYSQLTEKGQAEVIEFISSMAFKIRAAEEYELDHKAKELVLKGLKS